MLVRRGLANGMREASDRERCEVGRSEREGGGRIEARDAVGERMVGRGRSRGGCMYLVSSMERCVCCRLPRCDRGVRVHAWYCRTLTYFLMICMATVGMRVGRQPAAAEVGGGRSIPGGSAGPIRSVERPAAGHRSVVQSPSEERSDRIVTSRRVTSRRVASRQSRVESSDRWGRWSGHAVVGYGGGVGGMGWM